MLLLEGDQPVVLDEHVLAGRGGPADAAAQDTRAHVERALVLAHVGDVERQRLVVDVDAHDLRVGRVDDRLPDLGEAVGLLGVADRERLVESVDERAVLVREAALDVVAAQAEVAVADGEEGLGDPDVIEREAVSTRRHGSTGNRSRSIMRGSPRRSAGGRIRCVSRMPTR